MVPQGRSEGFPKGIFSSLCLVVQGPYQRVGTSGISNFSKQKSSNTLPASMLLDMSNHTTSKPMISNGPQLGTPHPSKSLGIAWNSCGNLLKSLRIPLKCLEILWNALKSFGFPLECFEISWNSFEILWNP